MPDLMWRKKYVSNVYWKFFGLFASFGFRVCDKILVPTVSTGQDLYTNFSSSYHHKIEFLPEHCDESYWREIEPNPVEILLNKTFIFHPAGLKPSKNSERAIRAFLEINLSKEYYFVLISNKTNGFFSKGVDMFRSLLDDSNIIILNSISDNEMKWLYSNCSLVSVPSIEEGVGLPVLEALYFDKPVVVSTASALPQTSGCKGYYVNPFSVNSIADAYSSILRGGKGRLFYEKMSKDEVFSSIEKIIS